MEDFVEAVEDALNSMLTPIELVIPYSNGQDLSVIHEQGVVETIDYKPEGTYVLGRVPQASANRFQKYSIAGDVQEVEKTASADDEVDWAALGRGRHSKE